MTIPGSMILTDRAVKGIYYQHQENKNYDAYVNMLAQVVPTDQPNGEMFPMLSPVAQFSEDFTIAKLNDLILQGKIFIKPSSFGTGFKTTLDDWEFDKTGQIQVRIQDIAAQDMAHKFQLAMDAINAGSTTLSYEGVAARYFFDTGHVEGDSGTQSNKITYDSVSTTAPTAAEMAAAIQENIQKMYSFVNMHGTPMNETAQNWALIIPTQFWNSTIAALNNPNITIGGQSTTNTLAVAQGTLRGDSGYNITVMKSARLNTAFASKFVIVRTDSPVKPLIMTELRNTRIVAQTPADQKAVEENQCHVLARNTRGTGLGLWQYACETTFI